MAEKGDNVNLLMVIAFNNVCDNQDLTPLVSQTTNTRKVFLRGEQRKAETQKKKKCNYVYSILLLFLNICVTRHSVNKHITK